MFFQRRSRSPASQKARNLAVLVLSLQLERTKAFSGPFSSVFLPPQRTLLLSSSTPIFCDRRRRRRCHHAILALPPDASGGDSNKNPVTTTDTARVRFTAEFLGNNNNNNNDSSGQEDDNLRDNPFDRLLSWLSSDLVSIILGVLGLLWVVVHRLTLLDDDSAADALTLQTRTDLLAVLACGSVLLNGVTKLDVTTALAETVQLEGTTLSEPDVQWSPSASRPYETITSWALASVLVATPAKTAVLLQRKNINDGSNDDSVDNASSTWIVTGRVGVLPETAAESNTLIVLPEKTPILDRVGSVNNVKETYLPTLQALPGRFEFFSYLPANTQLALLIPVVGKGENNYNDVLVLGGNTAKAFTPRDIAWCRIIAERIGEELQHTSDTGT